MRHTQIRVKANDRIWEIENSKVITDEMKKEYNKLLDLSKTIPGIMKRKKYEIPKAKKGRKKGVEERRDGEDVGGVQEDLVEQTPL